MKNNNTPLYVIIKIEQKKENHEQPNKTHSKKYLSPEKLFRAGSAHADEDTVWARHAIFLSSHVRGEGKFPVPLDKGNEKKWQEVNSIEETA